MRFRVAFQSLRRYRSFSNEVPFPQIERPCSAHDNGNVLAANIFAVKEYETESAAFAGCERLI
jgi:hypothetical protein